MTAGSGPPAAPADPETPDSRTVHIRSAGQVYRGKGQGDGRAHGQPARFVALRRAACGVQRREFWPFGQYSCQLRLGQTSCHLLLVQPQLLLVQFALEGPARGPRGGLSPPRGGLAAGEVSWSPGCATGLCWPPWRVFRPRSRWRCSPMRARCIPMRFSPPVPPSSHWRSRTTGPRGGGERTPRPRAGSPAPVDGAEDRVRGGAAVTALTASSSCSAPAASKTKPRLRQFLDACIRLGAIPVTVATGSKYQLLDFDPLSLEACSASYSSAPTARLRHLVLPSS